MTERPVQDPEEAYIGKDLGQLDVEINEQLLADYFEGLKIDPSWYSTNSPYDKPVVPSMVLTAIDTGFSGAGFKNNFGNLWMRQQWELYRPMFLGTTYTKTSTISDIYEWRNRNVVKQEVKLWSPNGDLMALGTHHQSFMLNQSSGKVALRDPSKKEGIRKFQVPAGELVDPSSHDIDLEMCGQFFHGNANYHTSQEAAEELGFERVVVGGRMTMSYLGDLMDKRFGQSWFEGGIMDIKFTNITWPDENVTAHAVVTGEEPSDDGNRQNVALWMDKPDGTVVIVGTASVKA